MVRWTVGNAQYDKMPKYNQITTWIYYISFVIFVYIMLMLSYQAIVINTYDEVKQVVMTRPSQLGTVIKLFIRDIYDLIYLLVCGKRKQRPLIDLDVKSEHGSEQRIDPRQAAEMAAMRQMEQKCPNSISQPDYLLGRLVRTAKRIKELEEVTNQGLKRLLEYYNILHKQHNMAAMRINGTEPDYETVV
ncbi:polycystic kidney disease 2-like 2 protein [Drosophila innubila]|uniref:polycystic kidney disease 2-like 2 protein n=1 Tax=Drosophila innubila TaxID=198719 RepID=UPI00148E4DE4|nr:polycystic kidney disease 2-like 2 protein [Drosophila innubila]